MFLPWIEKYRPIRLDDIIGNSNIITHFKSIAKKGNIPHMLLVGPPGTGKTTSINCLAKALLKGNFVEGFLELNASNERGIDVVRHKIKDFCKKKLALADGIHKIIFLDEVESMTSVAQQALRRIIEQYTHNTRFMMACNSSGQIIEPIQSRCNIKSFVKIQNNDILKRLKEICLLEKISYKDNALREIIEDTSGDMRKALNILQAVVVAYDKVNLKYVRKIANKPKRKLIKQILEVILEKKMKKVLSLVEELTDSYSMLDILHELFEIIKSYDMPDKQRLIFIKKVGKAEINLLKGSNSKLLLSYLIADLMLSV